MANTASESTEDLPPATVPKPGGIAARAMAANAPTYLDQLNNAQREAVEAVDGPVLVLAGAGTGKTKVLTTRLAHIINTGRARPSNILAVTFTNKAAREMKSRIGELVGHVVEGMTWLGTFHSIGVKILRRHAELVNLRSNFTILDTDDQIRLMKQVLKAENVDEKRWPARQLAGVIDNWKNRGLRPEDVPEADGFLFANGLAVKLYSAYQERLKTLNAADFGDLLLECLTLFRDHPDILGEYQDRFAYMLVDEYQDTNVAQYLWLRLLAQGRGNIACVGDDDQSIYGWRGAEVDNILRFETDFPGARVVRLEENYRSTQNILAAASALISHNEGRLGKTLHAASSEDGELVHVRGVWDAEDEARLVTDEVESLHGKGHRLDEIAVLVRASFQMREFEDRFIMLGLPYRVIGGPRFYERQEIRDAIAYLQVIANPDHDVKFQRIVNVPKRSIGERSLGIVIDAARTRGLSLYRAATEIVETDEIRGQARASLAELIASFERWRGLVDTMRHTELAEMILDESGYTGMWQQDRSPAAAGRLDNLKEMIGQMDEFESLAAFLEHVSLVMDVEADAGADKINLMTLHAAKGLEFDTVFLPGWEEGVFPNQRSLDEGGRAGLEEERRLAHVGLTRARHRAWISFASNRRIHGLWQQSIPSRFVDELPEDRVDVDSGDGYYAAGTTSRFATGFEAPFASTYDTPGWRRAQARRQSGSSDTAPPGQG
ncbi:MAG: UvrD-helicase domain-containing protein, partial [Rhizobiales bacterium]|nr:UvrD-helicase domain-containing protein [Hyphomicrobiales bacterium]